MVMKAILDSLDGLPEAFHEHYVQREGKFYLETDTLRTQADVDRLQGALNKERADHKLVRDRYAPLSALGIEVDEVVTRVQRFPELEIAAAGKIDEKKVEEIVAGRVKTATAPLDRELAELRTGVAERDTIIGGYRERDRVATIHNEVRAAATKAGLLPSAIEDALELSTRMFDIDETGRVVTKEGNGVSPNIDAGTWFTEMQPRRAHWWPESQGGGSRGSNGAPRGGENPFSSENWNVTKQMQVYKENPTQAQNLARAAGTSIGGPRPAPRK